MKRRAYVTALAAALPVAGCVGSPGTETGTETPSDGSGSTPTDSPTETPPPTETPDEDGFPRTTTSIVDLETATRTYALGPTRYHAQDGAEVKTRFVATATPDHPARIRATLSNGRDAATTFDLRWLPPFGRHRSGIPHPPGSPGSGDLTYRDALVVAPTTDNPLANSVPDVERDADGLWRAADVDRWLPERHRLDGGESVTAGFRLVGHPAGAGQGRPTGVYEFARPDEPSFRVTVWNTDAPGPGESRFEGVSLPSLSRDAETGWYHEADASTPSYVRPETERTDLPAAVPFTFVNHGRTATSCGHWRFYKLDGGEWFDLGPFLHTADCRIVQPGGWKRMVLRAHHGEALPCQGQNKTFGFLGGGRYAFVAGYGVGVDRSAALVEFDAPPVEVRPEDDLSTSRQGGRVVVTAPDHGDDDRREDATLVVERVDSADRRLLAEQVMRRRGLRNTLPFFESGVDTVELRTEEPVVDRAVRWEGSPFRFTFGGQAYEARKA